MRRLKESAGILDVLRYLPWILLAFFGVILGWQQVRLATLSAALGQGGGQDGSLECPPMCVCAPTAHLMDGDVEIDEAGGGDGTASQMSAEDELDAIYKQLNKQTSELEALQKQKTELEAQRDTSPKGGASAQEDPPSTEVKGWVFYQGMDFDGFDLAKKPAMRNKPQELIGLARHTPGCVAANTNGWLKSGVANKSKWYHWTEDQSKGLYVHKDAKIT